MYVLMTYSIVEIILVMVVKRWTPSKKSFVSYEISFQCVIVNVFLSYICWWHNTCRKNWIRLAVLYIQIDTIDILNQQKFILFIGLGICRLWQLCTLSKCIGLQKQVLIILQISLKVWRNVNIYQGVKFRDGEILFRNFILVLLSFLEAILLFMKYFENCDYAPITKWQYP